MSDGVASSGDDDAEEEPNRRFVCPLDTEFGAPPTRSHVHAQMGTSSFVTREGEIEIAKRIEDGLKRRFLRSPAWTLSNAWSRWRASTSAKKRIRNHRRAGQPGRWRRPKTWNRCRAPTPTTITRTATAIATTTISDDDSDDDDEHHVDEGGHRRSTRTPEEGLADFTALAKLPKKGRLLAAQNSRDQPKASRAAADLRKLLRGCASMPTLI